LDLIEKNLKTNKDIFRVQDRHREKLRNRFLKSTITPFAKPRDDCLVCE
jgi:hypothetical protein